MILKSFIGCMVIGVAVYASPFSEPVTSADIKTSLGKAIIYYKNLRDNQKIISADVKNLKSESKNTQADVRQLQAEVQQLKAELKEYKSQSMSNAANIVELDKTIVTTPHYLNLRARPTADSKILRVLTMCTKVEVEGCTINANNEYWCEVRGEGFSGHLRKKYLSFHTSMVRVSDNTNTESKGSLLKDVEEVTVLGVSPQKDKVCMKDGSTVAIKDLYSLIKTRKGK